VESGLARFRSYGSTRFFPEEHGLTGFSLAKARYHWRAFAFDGCAQENRMFLLTMLYAWG